MTVGICGYGKVGQAVTSLFSKNGTIPRVYDPPLERNDLNTFKSDYLFICVPTPPNPNGSCDTSIVEATLAKSEAKINIIRSTVWVGFTDFMKDRFMKEMKRIVFMPEYGPSEFPNHPFNDVSKIPWAVVGGTPSDTAEVADLWEKLLYNVKVFQTQARIAELLKLVENAYFYSKLTFFNQVYDICKVYSIDYDDLRMMLTEDPRIDSDHTFIHENNRKIGGRCLTKDMDNLIHGVKQYNNISVEFLELLRSLNEKRK